VALCYNSIVGTTQVPQGDGVIFIGNCNTPPTSGAGGNTTGGGLLFCNAGALYWHSTTTGSNQLIAPA
jgi:hypothetical protein